MTRYVLRTTPPRRGAWQDFRVSVNGEFITGQKRANSSLVFFLFGGRWFKTTVQQARAGVTIGQKRVIS